MTKILYIPTGEYLKLPTRDESIITEIYEDTYAYCGGGLVTPLSCIEYICKEPTGWLTYNSDISNQTYIPSIDEFEIIYD